MTLFAVVEWRPVEGFAYEVSNTGLVRRVGGRVLKDHPIGGNKRRPGGTDYRSVQLWRANRPFNRLVHCLVAAAFIGRCPDGHEVNHQDGDKAHNDVSNLEYLTRSQNLEHAYRLGLRTVTSGVSMANRVKTHCPQDHPYDETNTGRRSDGSRYCRPCARDRARAKAQRKRAA